MSAVVKPVVKPKPKVNNNLIKKPKGSITFDANKIFKTILKGKRYADILKDVKLVGKGPNKEIVAGKGITGDKTGLKQGIFSQLQSEFKTGLENAKSRQAVGKAEQSLNTAFKNMLGANKSALNVYNSSKNVANRNILADRRNFMSSKLNQGQSLANDINTNNTNAGTGLRNALSALTNAGVSESSGGGRAITGLANNIANTNNINAFGTYRTNVSNNQNEINKDILSNKDDITSANVTYQNSKNKNRSTFADTAQNAVNTIASNTSGTSKYANNLYNKLKGYGITKPITPMKPAKAIAPAGTNNVMKKKITNPISTSQPQKKSPNSVKVVKKKKK